MRQVNAVRAAVLAAGVVAAGLLAGASTASDVVFYRCVGADGAVTLQNGRRCPKGMREERRVMEVATSRAEPAVLAPVPPPAPVAPVPDATPVVEVAPTPAPPLFACRTWGGRSYYGDAGQPAPRCAPLETVGLDGRAGTGAQACETVYDTCEPVAEAARCEAWAQRLRTADDAARFGDADAAEAARVEAERIRGVLATTVCR